MPVPKRYKYFNVHRPPAPGAMPTEGMLHARILDERTYCPDIDMRVWGWTYYDRKLRADEVAAYELVAAPETVGK